MNLDKQPIVLRCAEMFHIHPRDLVSKYRFKFLMPGRYALCAALYKKGWSYAYVGRFLNRDHSTIMNAIERARYIMERDPEYVKKVDELAEIPVSITVE